MPDHDQAMRNFVANLPVPEFAETAFTPPPPLEDARVAIVTSAALYREGDDPFAAQDIHFETIPDSARDLKLGHLSPNFDRAGFAADLNVVYPVDRPARTGRARRDWQRRRLPLRVRRQPARHGVRGAPGHGPGVCAEALGRRGGRRRPDPCLTPVSAYGLYAGTRVRGRGARHGGDRPDPERRRTHATAPGARRRVPAGPAARQAGRRRLSASRAGRGLRAVRETHAARPRGLPGGDPVRGLRAAGLCSLPPRYDPELHPAVDEAQGLRAAYDRAVARHGRTTVGSHASADDIPDAIGKFARIAAGEPWDKVGLDAAAGRIGEEIRTYYEELGCELADAPAGPWAVERWFYERTETGKVLLDARRKMREAGAPQSAWFLLSPSSRG